MLIDETAIIGLPIGYEGVVLIVDKYFVPTGKYPFEAEIAPTSTKYKGEYPTIWAFVWPMHELHNCCGWFIFDCLSELLVPDNADVLPEEHQRKGIATSVYKFVAEHTKRKLIPADVQSQCAKLLWKSFRDQNVNFIL